MARRKSSYQSPNVEANRAYIEQQIANRRAPVRFRYHGGEQPGTQLTGTPLRQVKDNTYLFIDHTTRTPRAFSLDRLETLSDDEPRPEPVRVGDPATIAEGEAYRARRKQSLEDGVDEQLGTDLRFVPDRVR